MRLRHLHIPRLISYEKATQLQEKLIQQHFRYKDFFRSQNLSTSKPPIAPDPTILTFSTPPTYTVGRRYLPSFSPAPSPSSTTSSPAGDVLPPTSEKNDYIITPSQIAYLTGSSASSSHHRLAIFHPSPRGGLLTYHAPGQLTAFPLLNLRTHALTPRCYVRHLESVVIDTCTRLSVPKTTTTEDPGVWLLPPSTSSTSPSFTPRKICALGVQIRRGITGHGIGMNVQDTPIPALQAKDYLHDDGTPAPGYLSWGFGRIVACGLEGKGVTWLGREGGTASVEEAGRVFVDEFAKRLEGVEGVYDVTEEEVWEETGGGGSRGGGGGIP